MLKQLLMTVCNINLTKVRFSLKNSAELRFVAAITAASFVGFITFSPALAAPVKVENDLAKVTLSDDHFHPGETISLHGSGFTRVNNPPEPEPGSLPILAVKLNDQEIPENWSYGGDSAFVDTTGTVTSERVAMFSIAPDGTFSGTITIPSDQPSGEFSLRFLGGSLSTGSPGPTLAATSFAAQFDVIQDDETLFKAVGGEHYIGEDLALRVRNFTGIHENVLAVGLDGEKDGLTCQDLDSTGDADPTVQLPNSLDVGTHSAQLYVGTDCADALGGAPASTISFVVGNRQIVQVATAVTFTNAPPTFLSYVDVPTTTVAVKVTDQSTKQPIPDGSGAIAFSIGGQSFATVPVTDGSAATNLPTGLAVASQKLVATFIPVNPALYAASEVPSKTFTIRQSATTASVILNSASVTQGVNQFVSGEIVVSPQVAGTASLYVDGDRAASVAIESGSGTFEIPATQAVGEHSLLVDFSPTESGYNSSQSGEYTFHIAQAPQPAPPVTTPTTPQPPAVTGPTTSQARKTAVQLKVTKKSAAYGTTHKVKATATVSPTAAGKVTFYDGKKKIKTVTLKKGKATTTLPKNLTRGTHKLTAKYTPTKPAQYTASTSKKVAVTVKR
jgi:hypothetical protein